jgi:hypothetical protein
MFPRTAFLKHSIAMLIILLALATGACAALQPIDANGPRSNEPAYPIGLADPAARLEEASVAWYQMSQHYGIAGKTSANLNPYTGTLQGLPENVGTIVLPKVGTDPVQTEEQMRESLRRFLLEWRPLLGADPNQLSLVERTDEANGIKVARYEQRPFRYPLRGGFGNVIIRFRPDRRVVSIMSNCIPNADRLQAALGGLTPKINSDEAIEHVRKQPVVNANVSGWKPTFTLPSSAALAARQLVVYAQPSAEQASGLQLYLAWEIEVTNGPMKMVYLDAISDRVIAVA